MIPVIKIKEIITAHRLEKLYTKDEILTLYLNTVSFGEGTFGIESAAQKYFSTTATQLTIPEAATLIGLLKGPSYYKSPGSSRPYSTTTEYGNRPDG